MNSEVSGSIIVADASENTTELLYIVQNMCFNYVSLLKHGVYTEQPWRSILPALRLVQRGPEDHVALEYPGKKSRHT